MEDDWVWKLIVFNGIFLTSIIIITTLNISFLITIFASAIVFAIYLIAVFYSLWNDKKK